MCKIIHKNKVNKKKKIWQIFITFFNKKSNTTLKFFFTTNWKTSLLKKKHVKI